MSVKIQGGTTPTTPSVSDQLKADEQAAALKDIQKKTQQMLQQKGVQHTDRFAVEQAASAPASKDDKVAALAKLETVYPPEIKAIVEQAFKARLDPQAALRLQTKWAHDAEVQRVMAPLKEAVAQFEQQALKRLAETSPQQMFDDLKRAAQHTTSEATNNERQASQVVSDKGVNQARSETAQLAAGKDADKRSADHKQTGDNKQRADAKGTDAKANDANLKAEDKSATKSPAPNEAPEEPKTAGQTPEPTPTPTLEESKLGSDKPVEETAASSHADNDLVDESELGVDQYGNLLVEPQFVARAEQFMATAGFSPSFLQDYQTTLGLADQPLEIGAAAGGESAAAGSADLQVETSGGTYYAILGNLASGDLLEAAYVVLGELIKDLNTSMKLAQQAMKIKHQMNNAMRGFLAEYMRKTAHLTNTDVKDPEKMEKVEFQYMEPTVVEGDAGELEVIMTPVPYEQTFAPATVTVPTGNSSGDREREEKRSADWVYERSVPPQGRAEAAQNQPFGPTPDGKFAAKTSWTYITAGTVGLTQEMMKTRISTIKQDMEKEMLNVHKSMSLRKQVLENLTKMIKSRADEQQKIVAQLRR